MTTPLEQWVTEAARLTQPDRVVWCDGSEEEHQRLIDEMLRDETLIELDQKSHPGCYLHRSNPRDVARTEHLTFICTRRQEDAGPTNNWKDPQEAKETVGALFRGSMKGRTMYVVPYLMGPGGSDFSRVGVQVTDSPYVVASLRIMTRMGQAALDQLGSSDDFVPGLHGLGDLSPDRRYILHFPEEGLIWSIGSGYGGNALLAKKCFALRIASWLARQESWMAEHMLILGLEDPDGEIMYIGGAFPSACGKTNLAMLVSPLEEQGWRVWTLGDDIAWLRIGSDGRLWAVNPEAGFFGVVPGTNRKTNPNAMTTIERNSIYTNVALTPRKVPWWEGIDTPPPEGLIDWQGRAWSGEEPAAHPNARFTAPARQCPSISPHWEDPQGVPISAFIFGARRSHLVPLVFQAFDWPHGVYVAASMASETTAAATGKVGQLRRDPMAMLPFCGYHMGDYFGHWLAMGERLKQPPLIFHVNWFQKGPDGKFLWPGFGENIRVLMWIRDRVRNQGKAAETPIGYVPTADGLNTEGLDLDHSTLERLLAVDREGWQKELEEQGAFFQKFAQRLPDEIRRQMDLESRRLGRTAG